MTTAPEPAATAGQKQLATALYSEVDEKHGVEFDPSGSRLPSPPPSHLLTPQADALEEATVAAASPASLASPPLEPLQRWNESRTTILRYCFTLYAFTVMGMNDGAVGFGVAILGSFGRLAGYLPMMFHPPFPVLPVIMIFPGLGNGVEDSGWNAWVGNMENANELLGFLHGAYGLGATIAPLIATAMVTKANLPWYTFYYLMVGLSGLGIALGAMAFWGATGRIHRESHKSTTGQQRTTTRRVLREPITWLMAIFLLGYVGVEVSLGGWITTFMLNDRHAENFAAGLSVTGFWLGITVGRLVLGFVTGRIGEKLAITVYLLSSIGLQLLYWLVPSFIASAIFVGFLGVFLGPLFPAAVVAATKLLPHDFHVSAIGFAAAFGSGGGALFPFAVGAIAQSKGVEVLQPIVVAILGFILITWCFLPGGYKRGGLENAKENHESIGNDVVVACRWVTSKRTAVKTPLSLPTSVNTASPAEMATISS
ncbi:hypothetical protein SPBR_03669 [Sporothrix brasiliensis 5110]|uniref:Major facilitator superfamily (MFS) profile domain-containing protein n=1 Tax=Sporothrix brasiliensis 5110 TaxID=1398154 RepID=A0A0C2JDI0_9PEZI|nr:uncharacterized protein SPBR_03669 [Sporothrix brasiliensis 5110]KIH95007.1 hypothetical protein SPBR_03669 [Sporothrix brasiliensis 5110]